MKEILVFTKRCLTVTFSASLQVRFLHSPFFLTGYCYSLLLFFFNELDGSQNLKSKYEEYVVIDKNPTKEKGRQAHWMDSSEKVTM